MLSHKIRLYHLPVQAGAMRFHPLGCTPSLDIRCTFLGLRGFAQDYLILRLRLPLSSHGLYYAANVNAVSFARP